MIVLCCATPRESPHPPSPPAPAPKSPLPSPNLPPPPPPNPLSDGAALPPKAEPLDAPKLNPAPAAGAAVAEPKADDALLAGTAVEFEDEVLVKPNDKAAAPTPGAAAIELAAVPVLLDVALAPPNEKLAPAICVTHRQNTPLRPHLPPGNRQELWGCGCGKESTKTATL